MVPMSTLPSERQPVSQFLWHPTHPPRYITPDTIPIYSYHRYPTTFGIHSNAETNKNINFKTGGQNLEQIYSTMSTMLYSLLKEVISEDYHEAMKGAIYSIIQQDIRRDTRP